MPFHAHFELLNLDALTFKTRLCKVFSRAGYMATVSKHAMPRYLRVTGQLAENSANPTRFSGKACSVSNSTKGRDAPFGNLAYGKQYTRFGVGLAITFQCGRALRGLNYSDELTDHHQVFSRYA